MESVSKVTAPVAAAMLRDELPASWNSEPYKPIAVQGVEIYGKGYSQVLAVSLQPGSVLSSQPGHLMSYDRAVNMSIDTGGLGGAAMRIASGEHPMRLNFHNPTSEPQTVTLASKTPGCVIPINLAQTPSFIFRKGAFLAAFGLEWSINLRIAPTVGVAVCGGMGAIMSEIRGNSIAFIIGCGSIVEKVLRVDEKLSVDVKAVVGFDSTVQQEVTCFGSDVGTILCSGQGPLVSTFRGPGRVFIQSMPVERLRGLILQINNNDGGGGGGGGDSGGG